MRPRRVRLGYTVKYNHRKVIWSASMRPRRVRLGYTISGLTEVEIDMLQ